MTNHCRLIILIIALALTFPVFAADIANTQIRPTGKEGLTIDANRAAETDLAQASLWDLSEKEWRRYKQLVQGIRGSISPSSISPIEVLGIHARNEAERQRYAEVWARIMYQDAGRILAFQHAYDTAVKRLYPHEQLINISQIPRKPQDSITFESDDRLLYFTRPECPACDLMLNKLLKRINEVSGIDIYLTGVAQGDDSAVREWAVSHKIDPAWVRSHRITLNHDAGALDKLTHGKGDAPTLLRRRGEELSLLRISDL